MYDWMHLEQQVQMVLQQLLTGAAHGQSQIAKVVTAVTMRNVVKPAMTPADSILLIFNPGMSEFCARSLVV